MLSSLLLKPKAGEGSDEGSKVFKNFTIRGLKEIQLDLSSTMAEKVYHDIVWVIENIIMGKYVNKHLFYFILCVMIGMIIY